MNRIALFWMSIMLSVHVAANNKVVISMNMNECNACYNALSYLDLIDSSIELIYIFPEAYQTDSADIQALFEFPLRGRFIWSDKLNKEYLINSFFTSLTYTNSEECNPLVYRVKEEMNKELVAYINSLNQPEYVYTFDEDIFSPANHFYYFYQDQLLSINKLRNHLMVSDMKTEKVRLLTDISDTLIHEAYLKYFKDEKTAKEKKDFANRIAEEHQLKAYQSFNSLDVYKDKIYLSSSYLNFVFRNNNEDTLQSSITVIHVFDFDANLLNTIPIRHYDEAMVNNLKRDSNGHLDSFYFLNPGSTFKVINDSTFYFENYAVGNLLRPDFKAYFLASYEYDPIENELIFKDFFPPTLQERYRKIGYNFSNPRFSWKGNAFTIPFNDEIYFSDADNFHAYSLNVFEGLPMMENLFSDPYRGNVMANKSGPIIYLLFEDAGTLYYYQSNMNKKTAYKVNVSELLTEKNHRGGIFYPDPFDYGYLYYPISNHQLKRIKIF